MNNLMSLVIKFSLIDNKNNFLMESLINSNQNSVSILHYRIQKELNNKNNFSIYTDNFYFLL